MSFPHIKIVLSHNLIDCEDCDSCEDDGEQETVDGAAHHALEHEVEGLKVGDFAAGTLLGDVTQAFVTKGAVVKGGEQDAAVANDVLSLVAASGKEINVLFITANLYRLRGELSTTVIVTTFLSPLNQSLNEWLLQPI